MPPPYVTSLLSANHWFISRGLLHVKDVNQDSYERIQTDSTAYLKIYLKNGFPCTNFHLSKKGYKEHAKQPTTPQRSECIHKCEGW